MDMCCAPHWHVTYPSLLFLLSVEIAALCYLKTCVNSLHLVCESEQQITESVLEFRSSVDRLPSEVAFFLIPPVLPCLA